MIDIARFKPKTVYVIYIASTPEKIWAALTAPEFTTAYFFGASIEIEPKAGGAFVMRKPDGTVDVSGEVVEWSPPRRLAVTWGVRWLPQMRDVPDCLVSYDIEQAGDSVRLTMTEAHQWDVPDALLTGGRAGWAGHPVEPQEPAGNRQATGHQDAAATRNARRARCAEALTI